MDYGIWSVSAQAGSMPLKAFGFIYTITNQETGRSYIGKKQLNSYSMKKVPGKVRRVKEIKESNWRVYQSSSKYVKADIKEFGKDSFSFVIEEWCCTRAELTYRECELQWQCDVLSRDTLPNGQRRFYNEAIGAIKFVCPEFCSDSTRAKLREVNLGMKNPNFKGMVVAKCSRTGHEVGLFGSEDMKQQGFLPSAITMCLKGQRRTHKGYTFERRDES